MCVNCEDEFIAHYIVFFFWCLLGYKRFDPMRPCKMNRTRTSSEQKALVFASHAIDATEPGIKICRGTDTKKQLDLGVHVGAVSP